MRETRNHVLTVIVVAAVIVPLYFVPSLHRLATPILNVLQAIASVVHVLVLVGLVLLVVVVVSARLWSRRVERRAAREAGEWWRRPGNRGAIRRGGSGAEGEEEVGG